MILNEKSFIMLRQLLGCYLHQDWTCEFSNDSDAINMIVQVESKDRLALAVSEIDLLLFERHSDSDLQNIMVNMMGCYFDPAASGVPYVDWLVAVRIAFSEK